jgi:hypothetical protein
MTENVFVAFILVVFLLLAALVYARAGDLPNPELTPGVVAPHCDLAKACGTKWGKDHRFVTAAMKAAVFKSYRFSGNQDKRCDNPDSKTRRCEIDHSISRELCGADDVKNLWPQPYAGVWNATMKDTLENRLHEMVCAHQITLAAAQKAIATNWKKAFQQYGGVLHTPHRVVQ